MTDGLKRKHRAAIIDALATNERVERAVLFGSRATETYTSVSDADIALIGERLTLDDLAHLAAIIDELTVPQEVDLLLYATINDGTLREHIDKQGIEWYRRLGSEDAKFPRRSPRHRAVLERILRERLPGAEAWVCGCRRGRDHDGYDLDLVLRTRNLRNIPDDRLADLKQAMCASSVPIRINPYDWARLPERFQSEIERGRFELVGKTRPDSKRNWLTVPLGQVAELTLSSVDKKTKPDEYPVLLCNYMDVYSNRFIRSDLDFMKATATEREIQRFRLRVGDVVFTKDSERHDDIGVPALVRDDVNNLVCGYHLAILRPLRKSILGPYLFYAMQIGNVQNQFRAYANGITRFALRKNDILRVEIPLPSLREQQAIAHILNSLDEKVEASRRMNETLEALAQSIFKDWFVDFGPVRAKQANRRQFLPRHIVSLFPNRLVDSEIGKIPNGWKVGQFVSFFEILSGGTPKTSETRFWNGQIPWVAIADLKSNGTWLTQTQKLITEQGLENSAAKLLPKGTVIVTVRGTVGRVAIAGKEMTTNQSCFALRALPQISEYWVYLQLLAFVEALKSNAHGSVFDAITKKTFKKLLISFPPMELIREFHQIVSNLFERILINDQEIETLSEIRDTLSPKLISGELRIPDAEKLLAKASI